MKRRINVPPLIEYLINAGAVMAISISGGKDSQSMLSAMTRLCNERGWSDQVFALHMDLGRIEHPINKTFIPAMANRYGHELIIICRRNKDGEVIDLVDTIAARMKKLEGQNKPHWPSAAARYCTSYHKSNVADKLFRQFQLIISVEGLRWHESKARSHKTAVTVRKSITTKRLKALDAQTAFDRWEGKGRLAITWYPILEWSIDDVFAECDTSSADLARRRNLYTKGHKKEALAGWPCHPAYVAGNKRVSCAICILACNPDIVNGARVVPEVFQIFKQMEQDSGFAFKKGFWLSDLDISPAKRVHLQLPV